MAVTITYNGINPFGAFPPTISEEVVRQDINGYISSIDRFTLSGVIKRSSCSSNFSTYEASKEILKSQFFRQFKPFEIQENGTQVFYHPAAKVTITFPSGNYSSFYRYEIVVDCVKGYNNQDILDPVNEWQSQEDENGMVTLTHTVAARGVGDNALEKAKNFVSDAANSFDTLLLLDSDGDTVLSLEDGTELLLDSEDRRYARLSRRIFVDRFSGQFRMVETWIYDPANSSLPGVLTYQTSVGESNGETTVEISGEIQVMRVDAATNEIFSAKTHFDAIDFQAIAQQEYENSGGELTLSNLVSFSVNENPDLGTVNFSMSWNSLSQGSPYIVDKSTVMISKSGESNCFQYSGKVTSDAKCSTSRASLIKTFFDNVDWNAKVLQKWAKYGTGQTLTANAKSKSITINNSTGDITFSITYCADPELECGAIEAFKYSMEWTPSITKYAADPVLNGTGQYIVQNLGFKNRQLFSINGTAKRIKCYSKDAAKGEIRARVNLIMVKYFPSFDRILISNQISEDKNGDFFSFSFSWSGKAN